MSEHAREENRNQWLASFPEMNPNPIIEIDARGAIMFANAATGITLKKIGFPEDPALFLPDDIEAILRQLREGSDLQVYREIYLDNMCFSENIILNRELQVVRIYTTDITERKRAGEDLQLKEFAIQSSINAIAISDLSGKLTYVNPALVSMWGYKDKTEVLGRSYLSFWKIPDEAHQVVDMLSRDGTWEGELTGLRKDGTTMQVQMSANLIRNASGSPVAMMGSFIDITERKQAERELTERLKELKCLYDISALLEQPDISLDEIFKGILLLMPRAWMFPEITECRIMLEEQSFQTARFRESSWKLVRKIFVQGNPVGQLEVCYLEERPERDEGPFVNEERLLLNAVAERIGHIIERKRAEDALQVREQQNALQAELLEKAPVIAAFHDKDLNIVWANQAYEMATGLSVRDMVGKKCYSVWNLTHACNNCPVVKAIETGEPNEYELTPQNQDHWPESQGYWLSRASPVRDRDGSVLGAIEIAIDITERRKVENALAESEAFNKSIIQNSLDCIKILDTQGNLQYMSKAGQKLLEIRDINLYIGKSWIDFWTGKDHKAAKKAVLQALNGDVGKFTGYCQTEKGTPKWWDVVITPIKDQTGEVIKLLSISRDITEHKLADEALFENERKLQDIVHGSPIPQFVIDKDHRVINWNKALEEYSCIKADEVLGTRYAWKAFYNKERPVMADLLVDGRTDKIPHWYAGKYDQSKYVESAFEATDFFPKMGTSGVWLHFTAAPIRDSKGTIIGAIETLEDITERKQAEEFLKNALSLLNAALESTADGILVVDQHGKITSYNENFVSMWNIPPEIVKTQDYQKLISYFTSQMRDSDGFLENMNNLRLHLLRESYDMIELHDGRIFERYSKPQKIGKDIVGRVWSFRDITDRKRSEEKLVASLQEKEVLLREIHHRVKNNLQLITGLLDMTRMRTQDEITTGILTDMMLKIQTMAQIHTRLYESKHFGKIGLTGQFRDQVTALSNIYSHKGHEISCEIHAEEIFLPVDQALPCALVVNELLSNSYKHAFKGKKHGTIDVSAVQENGHIRITVKDDGIGIPPDFDISHTNSLGMKLVRTLVMHQLKGSIHITSHHGTEMIVEFPLQITRT